MPCIGSNCHWICTLDAVLARKLLGGLRTKLRGDLVDFLTQINVPSVYVTQGDVGIFH